MIRFLIYRPVSVFVVYLALIILAIIGISYLPVSLLPDIDIPHITILVEGENRSIEEIERLALAPIRQKLAQVDGLKDIQSIASFESGIVELEFEYGKNIDHAFLEVNEKVDRVINILPEGMPRPRVIKAKTGDLPVYFLSLSYKLNSSEQDFASLSEFAEQVVRRRLEQLPEIAVVDIHGLTDLEIAILPDENKMQNLGLTQVDLQKALEAQNLTFGSLIFKERNYQFLLRLGKPLSSIKDIREVPLLINKRIFRLAELAEVKIVEQAQRGWFTRNGRRAISLAIIKSEKAKIEELKEQLDVVIQQLLAEQELLQIEWSRDHTYMLRFAINNLRQNLLWGCFFAIGIVFFFYRNWRIPILIGLSVPLSILLSLLFFWGCGLSVNIISLSGIILGLGLMIDNGIIVLDNVAQKQLEGDLLEDACIKGTNEMIRPLLSSMLTTCSVFLPMIFLSGITGALFYDQALAISIGLLVSYIVSISFLPVFYFLLFKKQGRQSSRKSILIKLYDKGLHLIFQNPRLFSSAILIFLIGSVFLLQKLSIKRLPNLPQQAFELFIDWNEPITLSTASDRVEELFRNIIKHGIQYDAHLGEDQYLIHRDEGTSISTTKIYVSHGDTLNGNLFKQSLLNNLQAKYPDASWEIQPEKSSFELVFPQSKDDIQINIYTEKQTVEAGELIVQSFQDSLWEVFPDLEFNVPALEKMLLITPLAEQLLLYQVDRSYLYQRLKQFLNNFNVLNIVQFQYEIPVVITSERKSIQRILAEEQIRNKEGQFIPLSYLLELKEIEAWKKIVATGNGVFLPITVNTSHLNEFLDYLKTYDVENSDLRLEIKADYTKNQQLLRELLMVLFVALLMLYFIMTAQFESFLQPLIILMEIPISLAGSICLLYVFGESLNLMAMIGMIVTVGIVINDSIIKIDTINQLKRQGIALKEAIHLGGLKRLNPIIMTSLTTILAILPVFFTNDLGATLQRPLALALIGGLFIGTIISLYFIPLVYYRFYK